MSAHRLDVHRHASGARPIAAVPPPPTKIDPGELHLVCDSKPFCCCVGHVNEWDECCCFARRRTPQTTCRGCGAAMRAIDVDTGELIPVRRLKLARGRVAVIALVSSYH